MKKLVLITCLVACASVAPQADVIAAQPAAAPAAAKASPCNRKKIMIYSGITAALGLALAATPWISGASWGDIFDSHDGVNGAVDCQINNSKNDPLSCTAEMNRLNSIQFGARYLLGMSALALGTPLMVGLYKAIGVLLRPRHARGYEGQALLRLHDVRGYEGQAVVNGGQPVVAPQPQHLVPQQPVAPVANLVPPVANGGEQPVIQQPGLEAITAENAAEKIIAWQAALHDRENTQRFAARLNSLGQYAQWEPSLINAQYYQDALENLGLSAQGWTHPTPWTCPQCSYKNHCQNTPLCLICLCENENAQQAAVQQEEENKEDAQAVEQSTSAEATADQEAERLDAERRVQEEREHQEQENARKREEEKQERERQEELTRQQQQKRLIEEQQEQADRQREQEAASNAKPVTPLVANPAPAVAVQPQQALVMANTPEAVNALVTKIVTGEITEDAATKQVSPGSQAYFTAAFKVAQSLKTELLTAIQHVPQPPSFAPVAPAGRQPTVTAAPQPVVQTQPTAVATEVERKDKAPQPIFNPSEKNEDDVNGGASTPVVKVGTVGQDMRTTINTLAKDTAEKTEDDKVDSTDDVIAKIVDLSTPEQQPALDYLKQALGLKSPEAKALIDTTFNAQLDAKKRLAQ